MGVWERRLPRSGLPLLTSLCIHNSSQEGEVSPLEEEVWLIVVSPSRRFLVRRPRRHNTVFPKYLTNFSARLQFFCSVVFACWAARDMQRDMQRDRQTQARSWC